MQNAKNKNTGLVISLLWSQGVKTCGIARENELNMEETDAPRESLRMEGKIYRKANECC